MWLARVRSFIARHRAIYWSVIAGLAAVIAFTLATQSRQVTQARDDWGASAEVWVASTDGAAGDVISVARRTVPVAMVPDHAVTGAWQAGAVARHSLSRGEIVVSGDVGAGRLPLLPAGWHAVALSADDSTIPVAIGDHVDIVAVGGVLASNGVVVDIGTGAVVIGVTVEDAANVAAAALDRTAVVVVRPD